MANTRAPAAVIAGPFPFPGRSLGQAQGRGQAAQGGRGAHGRDLVLPGWPPEAEPGSARPTPVQNHQGQGNIFAEDDWSAEDDGPSEIGFIMGNLGFPMAFIDHLVVREGITELNHFLDVVDSIFKRLDTARIPYTSIQRSLIKSLYLYVRRMRQTNTPINLDAIDFDLLSHETVLADYHKAQKSKFIFPSSFKDHTKWRAFKDMFMNYLYSISGAKNIPSA